MNGERQQSTNANTLKDVNFMDIPYVATTLCFNCWFRQNCFGLCVYQKDKLCQIHNRLTDENDILNNAFYLIEIELVFCILKQTGFFRSKYGDQLEAEKIHEWDDPVKQNVYDNYAMES